MIFKSMIISSLPSSTERWEGWNRSVLLISDTVVNKGKGEELINWTANKNRLLERITAWNTRIFPPGITLKNTNKNPAKYCVAKQIISPEEIGISSGEIILCKKTPGSIPLRSRAYAGDIEISGLISSREILISSEEKRFPPEKSRFPGRKYA